MKRTQARGPENRGLLASTVIMQAINSANTGTLKNTAYLERQDGKRLFLNSYLAPIQDGLGAKFIFPRSENGAFFLTAQSDTVRICG